VIDGQIPDHRLGARAQHKPGRDANQLIDKIFFQQSRCQRPTAFAKTRVRPFCAKRCATSLSQHYLYPPYIRSHRPSFATL